MKTFHFKNREQILGLIKRADDNQETIKLISQFNDLKSQRIPMFLDESDFENILKWKLLKQFGRGSSKRQLNTDEIIQKITRLVFAIEHSDKNYEIELKLNILTSIRGVGIPIASAILTLTYPDKYAVVDFRVWRQLFETKKSIETKKSNYTTADYLKYLGIIKELAIKYDLNPQQIDIAIWQYDKDRNG